MSRIRKDLIATDIITGLILAKWVTKVCAQINTREKYVFLTYLQPGCFYNKCINDNWKKQA